MAYLLKVNRKTVDKYFLLIGDRSRIEMKMWRKRFKNVEKFQADEMESFVHTKCKPVSIPLAVTSERFILGVTVSSMGAKGHLVKVAKKKGYPLRPDHRKLAFKTLMSSLQDCVTPTSELITDQCPRYPKIVSSIFPEVTHKTFLGGRGCIAGYGEMKKKGFDPMFPLNHTAAMIRYGLGTMHRRTWTSTKKIGNLLRLLHIYACQHNRRLAKQLNKKFTA